MIGLNCIFAGILFVAYVIKHNSLHGKVFVSLVFTVDTIFELIYCVFPLLYLASDNNNSILDLKSLGLLNEQNFFVLFQSLFAMFLLVKKCHNLMKDLNPSVIIKNYWKHQTKIDNTNNDNIPWIELSKVTQTSKRVSTRNRSATAIISGLQSIYNNQTDVLYRITINTQQYQTITNLKKQLASLYKQKMNLLTHAYDKPDNDKNDDVDNSDKASCVAKTSLASSDDIATNGHQTEMNRVASRSPTVAPKGDCGMNFNNLNDNVSEINTAVSDSVSGTNRNNNINHIRTQQRRRSVVLMFGIILISVGITLMAGCLSFINNDYYNKCVNIDSNSTWIIQHPELKHYKKYCNKKVVNLFNSDYPCNCRLFLVTRIYDHNSTNSIDITQSELEMSMIRYTNLEGIFIDGLVTINSNYNFTSDMFSNLNRLKVFGVINCEIHEFSDNVDKLSNLEVFVMRENISPFYMPFEQISKLSKLKILQIRTAVELLNTHLPTSICDLSEIRFFSLTSSYNLESIPLDCMAENWKKLSYFDVQGIYAMYVPLHCNLYIYIKLHTHMHINQHIAI